MMILFFEPGPLPMNTFVAGRRRALRTVQEDSGTVEHLHLNPVRLWFGERAEEWRGRAPPNIRESRRTRRGRCGLVIERVQLPAETRTRI